MNKKILFTGLVIAMLNGPLLLNTNFAFANEQPRETAIIKNDLTEKQALQLATNFSKAASYVQRGGDYKEGEYKTFNYQGKTYRYLAASLDTKKELLVYLKKTLTSTAAENFIESRGIIEYKGKMAQVEADSGSLLQWEKATVQFVKKDKNSKVYRLTVPVGETAEKQSYVIEYQDVQKVGWRISKEPMLEQNNSLSNKQAVELATNLSKISSFVQAGGSYRNGEYRTFTYEGKTYRYLSSQIDTKTELMAYLKTTLTERAAEDFIQSRGIIEYKGKMAQIEADGGSLLQWEQVTAQLVNTEKNTTVYLLTIPVGESGEKQDYLIEYQYVEKTGWRISKEPYRNLDIPGNVNPAFNFVHLLLKNTKATQDLFLDPSSFNVEQFKKGIKKIEYIHLTEIGRNKAQVEFIVKTKVELDKNYKGTLVNGENNLYFLVQSTGYMDFKIVKVGRIALY